MKVFVSGATGFIGSRLANVLAEKGFIVHALYRSENKTSTLHHKNIRLFKGDILDKNSLEKAVKSCEQVYHVAAYASVWEKNPALIYHLNIEGSINIIEVAKKEGVKKIVLTSTAGVLGSSQNGTLDENSYPDTQFGDYESSKFILEKIVRSLNPEDIKIVLVNPSRVFGPGLLSESNSVTIMIDKYLRGKWHYIPGDGESIGNYVYIDDVVSGHILAMEKGKAGERYILGGENLSFNEFFDKIRNVSGKKTWLVKLPLWMMILISKFMMFLAHNFGIKPMITPAHVKKFNRNFRLDTKKAEIELGYKSISFEEALKKTIIWINEN